MKTCPVILQPPHPRAGQPCGRRCMREACENHRPKPVQANRPRGDSKEKQARRREQRRIAGLPAGWEGL